MVGIVWWIPESPRYYVSKDQPEKALAVLAKYHAQGNEQDEVVQLEFAEITSALALERAAKNSFSFVDFLRTSGNRHRLAIIISVGLFSQWSGNGLVSYYINLIMDSIGITNANRQLLINGALTTFNLVTNFVFSFFVERWGRRMITLTSTVGMFVGFVIWTILEARYAQSPNPSLGKGVLGMIFICKSRIPISRVYSGTYPTV